MTIQFFRQVQIASIRLYTNAQDVVLQHTPLHPIMFLLNRVEVTAKLLVNDFTSHYVPIKSVKRANNAEGELSLHPIMFLLNR